MEDKIEKIFERGKNVYIVGIKGAGVSALAQILKGKGYRITGSDTHEKFFTDALLKKNKIKYFEGFDEKHISDNIDPVRSREVTKRAPASNGIDFAISSNAYLGEPIANQEVLEIKKRGIPLLSYPEALSHIFNNSFGIAIAGTHGKTTTTAAVAFILHKAGLKPNALIGASSANLKSNAIVGRSNLFVLEADEYKDAFLNYHPNVIAILNTDWDHPDYFKTHADYKKSFEKFKKNIKPGGLVITPKDIASVKTKYPLKVIGDHNAYDWACAALIAKYLGVKDSVIKKAAREFNGTNRRLEIIGKYKSNIVVDDYAHNPQKIEAGLKALKRHYKNKKIIVAFQPHTYTRTATFLKDLAKSLIIADKVYLLDIYSSAREAKGTVTSDHLAKEIEKLGKPAINLVSIHHAEEFFTKNPPKNSVIVAMGAGDVGDLAHKLVKE